MNSRIKEKSNPLLIRWFISYLAILIIPLLFSIAVYFYSLYIINRSSEEIYEASLEQFRIEVDNFINSNFQTLQQLALNSDIQVLTLVKDELQPQDQWNLIQAIMEIRKIQIIFPMVDDIFVVLNPLESIMNSSAYYPLDLFYRLYYENEDTGLDAFITIMKEPRRNEIIPIGDKILLLRPSTEGFLGDTSATLAISYKKETFDNYFFRSYEAYGGKIFIVPENSPHILGSGKSNELPDHYDYRIFSRNSQVMNWKYLYFIPESLEKARARQIQLFTFGGLFICSVLGLFLSYWLSRRPYAMERKVMDTQAALGINLQALRKYYIHNILEKPFDPVHGKHEMERYNINLTGEWNLVTIFMVPLDNKVLSENEGEIINTLLYVIIHIFTEAVEQDFSVEITDVGEHAAAIISWSGDKDDFISRLEDKIEYTQHEAGDFLHFPILTALGEPRRGLEGIYFSNLEALETLRYMDQKTGQTILHYRDIKYSGSSYQYTIETEQKLINLVRLGDSKAACDLLHQVWFENSKLPGRMRKLLAYNLFGSLVKGMEQEISSDDFSSQGFNLENIPPEDLENVLEKAAQEICNTNSLLRQVRRENQLSGKVKEYIEENFKNPDINISITSLHFEMNPAYLAAVFREETGISLLEYINTLRIGESRKLLSSGSEVNEAAEKSGFRSSTAFIRVFKKMTGITPGQFKEL